MSLLSHIEDGLRVNSLKQSGSWRSSYGRRATQLCRCETPPVRSTEHCSHPADRGGTCVNKTRKISLAVSHYSWILKMSNLSSALSAPLLFHFNCYYIKHMRTCIIVYLHHYCVLQSWSVFAGRTEKVGAFPNIFPPPQSSCAALKHNPGVQTEWPAHSGTDVNTQISVCLASLQASRPIYCKIT